jgi:hypothetical protein
MSETVVVSSRGLDKTFGGTFDDPQVPRAEVRNRKAKPHQSKLDFRVREAKTRNASTRVSNKVVPYSLLGCARQTYIAKPYKNISYTY